MELGLGRGAITAESLSDKVMQLLVSAIESGELPPGTRIREAALASQLGISRGPLREALRRLEGRKLLEYTPNLGMRVATVSREDVIEIFQIREALEGAACRLATEAMSDEEVAGLGDLLTEHRTSGELRGGGYFQVAGDHDLHFRIVTGSRNRRLVEMLCGDLYHLLRVHRFKASAAPGRAGTAFEEHRGIVEAMQARDAERAEALMRRHIRGALAALLDGGSVATATTPPAAAPARSTTRRVRRAS